MPSQTVPPAVSAERTALLLEAVELLVDELALLAAGDWEKLPELKKKKVVAASRLRRLRAEAESADGPRVAGLEALIEDLEAHSRSRTRARLDLIGNQILALQELSLYLNESLHVTLQAGAKRPAAS